MIAAAPCPSVFALPRRCIRGRGSWMTSEEAPIDKPHYVGRCIYCLSNTKYLTEEHIFPRGLRGTLVLHDASCGVCQQKTQKLEDFVMRTMMDPARAKLGLRGQNPQGPQRGHAYVQDGKGGVRAVSVDLSEVPVSAILIVFSEPGIFLGAEKNARRDAKVQIIGDPSLQAPWREKHGNWASPELNDYPFARFLAKIAHTSAIKAFGIDGFQPFLQKIILGEDDSAFYYVGSRGVFPPDPSEDMFWAEVHKIELDDERLVEVRIRLFANWETAIYHVVTGRLHEGSAAPRTS